MTKKKKVEAEKPASAVSGQTVEESVDVTKTDVNEHIDLSKPIHEPETASVVPEVEKFPGELNTQETIVEDEFANMPEEYMERNEIPVEKRPEVSSAEKEPTNEPQMDAPVSSGPTDPGEPEGETPPVKSEPTPMNTEDLATYYARIGFPVVFEGSTAAIITKVWGKGLVNLTIFPDGSPVPDCKTSVPYGEGPNTWKEVI